ncbi:MAG TPA: group 1 truncated hemoglobin [Alphaproteobacteria bacterium]|jgi:hemoglobin
MRSACVGLLVAGFLAVASSHAAKADDDSLYRALGEKDGIAKIVSISVDKWLVDERIKDDVDNINLDRFRSRLTDQFCEITGGPCHYPGRDMYAAHKGLHLNTAKFNALTEDLYDAMDEVGVPFDVQNRLVALLAAMQRDVVTQ